MYSRQSSQDDVSLQKELDRHGLRRDKDNKVAWNTSNPDHPRNWTLRRKVYNNALILWLELFMTAISTAGTTAADSASTEYGISTTLSYFAFISTYLIGQTIGGILCSPISEIFGRRTLYIISSLIFCAFNIVTGVVPSVIAVYFGRFITGFVAAIPATVAFGNFSDCHDWEVRIWIVYSYTLLGQAGLAIGPIYAAYIDEAIGWRWIFYIAAIASFVSAFLAIGMKESNADTILIKKVKQIATKTGHDDIQAVSSVEKLTPKTFLQNSLFRPVTFLFTQPIIMLCAVFTSIAYGLFYGLTEGLTIVYEQFGFSKTTTSLAFIPLLIGLMLDVIPRFYEQHRFRKYRKQNRKILPETKIGSFAVACPALAVGLWLFAWTIPPLVTYIHWIVSMIGLVLIGFAANDFAYVLFTYVTDSYTVYAASAVSSLSLSRTLVAAAFPLFTTQMFEGLGANWAVTILAAVATLFSFTPILFLGWGARLRDKSGVAVRSEDVEDDAGDGSDSSDDQGSGDTEKGHGGGHPPEKDMGNAES